MLCFKYEHTYQQTSSALAQEIKKMFRRSLADLLFYYIYYYLFFAIYSLQFMMTDSSMCATSFNVTAASSAFQEVFPSMDGSFVQSISHCLLANHLAETVTRVFGISNESGLCTSSIETQQRVLMYASLALFASADTTEVAWAHVLYDPSVNSLQMVPSVTTSRQLFSDVIVVLCIVALARVWIFSSGVWSKAPLLGPQNNSGPKQN
jgi:hypothetical protein